MIKVIGKLVEVEERNGYRTAYVLDGRHVDALDVSKNVNGELDELVDQSIVAHCIYSVRWMDTVNGRRPSGKLVLVGVERGAGADELPSAA